jgi:predicted RNase H-like nuclease (RuvC/YqgF family)
LGAQGEKIKRNIISLAMRKIAVILMVVWGITACNQDVKDENLRLTTELESLKTESSNQDSTISNFMNTFGQVQENLSAIREREESIKEAKEGNLETASTAREQVLNDVAAINDLIENNKQALEDLKKKLASSQGQGRKYLRMVENLNRQIEAKDRDIETLRQQLAEFQFSNDQLTARVGMLTEAGMAQKKVIDQQVGDLNTAWYTMGNSKELVLAKVVNKAGGFIGIGRTEKLAVDFDKSAFTRIDLRETNAIPFGGEFKKVELVTNHATDSYVYQMNGDLMTGITITNSSEFWKNSKYLVILFD